MWKRLIRIGTIVALAGMVLVPMYPVNSTFLKLVLVGFVFGFWIGLVLLCWSRRPLRIAVLLIPLLPAVALLVPGREINVAALRADYVFRMKAFEGTKYFWGGENTRGIDCSGLPRRALRDALLAYGIRHANSRAFRSCLEQWWFDASAKALSEGYRGYAGPLGVAGTIRNMDYGLLKPGDLAITTSGVHVLAYAGQNQWIQADPGVGAVVTLDGRNGDNNWFDAPVKTHRWTLLKSEKNVQRSSQDE